MQPEATPQLPENQDLTFHPDFATPEDAEIFQAADGTCFRFKLSTLALMSTFFEDLVTLPVEKSSSECAVKSAVIPLPSASKAALHYGFSAIRAVLRGDPLPPIELPQLPNNSNKVVTTYEETLGQIISMADAYDLGIVLTALLRNVKLLPAQPPTIFAVANLARDTVEAQNQAFILMENGDLDIDCWGYKTLKAKNPMALIDYYELEKGWKPAVDLFEVKTKEAINHTQQSATCHCRPDNLSVKYQVDYFKVLQLLHLSVFASRLRAHPFLVHYKKSPLLYGRSCTSCRSEFRALCTGAWDTVVEAVYKTRFT